LSGKKKAVAAAVVILAIGGFVWFAVNNVQKTQSEAGYARNALPVEWELSHAETIVSKVSVKGMAELVDIEAVYPQTQARIIKLHPKINGAVRKGDILIEYDDKELQGLRDSLREAELSLESARISLQGVTLPATESERVQAQFSVTQAQKTIADIGRQIEQTDLNLEQLERGRLNAEKTYEDMKKLYDGGAVAKSELDRAKDSLDRANEQIETVTAQREAAASGIPTAEESLTVARAQYDSLMNKRGDPRTQNQIESLKISIEQAEFRIEQIERKISEFVLYEESPVGGTVITLNVKENDISVPGRPLMEIADVSHKNLTIKVNVPEGDARDLAVGQDVEIRGSALGRETYAGRVSEISPVAVRMQIGNTVETVLTVDIVSDNPGLKAGFTVDAEIITKITEDAVVIPIMSAISENDGNNYVYIMREDFTVEKRLITLGEYTGVYIEAEGVAVGEKIIVNPSAQLYDGAGVRPITRAGGR